MSVRHIAIILVLGMGATFVAIGLYRFFREAFRQQANSPLSAKVAQGQIPTNWLYLGTLFLILIIAFLLRMEGIDLRGMSHVEAYIPGINLPPLISEPPPRLDFLTLLSWHWHDEPHPQGYYILMFFWTKLFGTSLVSIRFPSVIFGVGAVALTYVLASMSYNRKIGLIAAAFLAMNGHHIYWSQNARMYAMACFLGLASAIILLAMLRQSTRRPHLEAGYILVTFLGLFTQLFFWTLLAAQMLLALIYSRYDKKKISRIFSLQVLVAILGSPLWAHAVYRSRPIDMGSPTMAFIQDFANFGFLFLPDYFSSVVPRDISPTFELAVTVIALACLLAGLINRAYTLRHDPPHEPVDAWKKLIPVAIGFSLIIIALSILAWRRQTAIAITAIVPLVALLALPAINHIWPQVTAAFSRCAPCQRIINNSVLFILMLSALPVSLLVLVSMFKTMMIPRGFLQFVPYLLIVQAAGVEYISRKRMLAIPLLIILAAIHLYSFDYHRRVPDPTDYRGLAHQMINVMQADDLIFVYPRDWATTPLFYYFQGQEKRIVADDYSDVLAAHPSSRVWMPLFTDYKKPSKEMHEALQNYKIIDHVSAHNVEADLYSPDK